MEILLLPSIDDAPAVWASFHAFRHARGAESSTGDEVIADAEFEALSREEHPNYVWRRWLAVEAGQVIGTLKVAMTRPGSPDHVANGRFATADLEVLGPWRRRGVATRLIAQLYRVMCEEAREVVTVVTDEPDGHAVLQHMGARDRLRMIDSRLQMDEPDWTGLERMKAAAITAVPDLQLEAYRGRVPRDVYEPLLPAMVSLFAEAPSGDLEHGGARPSVESIEAFYRGLEKAGGAHHFILLRAPGGGVAGFTEAVWRPQRPHRCWHNFTGVERPWRGRKLALALKIAVLQQVREAHREVVETSTIVAAQNAPMLAVNAKIGFRPAKANGTYQLERIRLAVWLANRVGGAHGKSS
jgi:GNAT superfamily N-acetyltransferase